MVAGAMAQAVPPCFFQTAHEANAALYGNNSVTSDNLNSGSVYGTQLQAQYQVLGNNGVLADGPAFYVTTPCVIDRIAYQTTNGHLDVYTKHYRCAGGTFIHQGDTVAGTPATPGGNCTGSYDVAYINTYDLGIYCEGGGCTYGKLYANTGPIPYSTWFSMGVLKIGVQFFKQGPVVLPSGIYGMIQGGNCDSGSVPGSANGTGDTLCGELAGEGGADTSTTAWNGTGEEFYAHKLFSRLTGTTGTHHCLLYDPLNDNSIGLPSSYTAYDNGGCLRVNGGSFTPTTTAATLSSTAGAPHMAHVVIMGSAQSIVRGASKLTQQTKIVQGVSIR
jgi:hypothetical protein